MKDFAQAVKERGQNENNRVTVCESTRPGVDYMPM